MSPIGSSSYDSSHADLHASLKEHGVSEIRTRDRAFERFAFLKVVDPLTMESMPENDAEQ